MSINPIQNSFSFIPGFMMENLGDRLILGAVDSNRASSEDRWGRSSSPRTLAGRVTVLPPLSSPLPLMEYDGDIYEEELRKPSPPILPPFPVKPQRLDISMIREIPAELEEDELFVRIICPITACPIRDPLVDRRHSAQVYERRAVNKWLLVHDTSPLTGEKMTLDDLVPDFKLKVQIDEKLRIWSEKQHEDALQKYGETVKKHEVEVQEILAKHKLAMSEYEVALKEREEEEQSRQMPLGADFAKLPSHVKEISIVEEDQICDEVKPSLQKPYGADLLKSNFSEIQKIHDYETSRILEQSIRSRILTASQENKNLCTSAKVNSVAMQVLGAGLMGSAMMSQSSSEDEIPSAAVMGMVLSANILNIGGLLNRRDLDRG